MSKHQFTIPGKPMAWQRPRRHGHIYFESKEQVNFKSHVALFARDGLKGTLLPLMGSISLEIDFYFARPKRFCRRKDPQCPIHMISRPDADNCLKMIGDALNGIVWTDDAQIQDCRVRKWYHEINGAPRTTVQIEALNEGRLKELEG